MAPTCSLASPNGAYSVILPTGIPGINYAAMAVNAYDPITGATLGTLPINVSSLPASGTYNAGSITGTCVDTDAGAPDADDPDCD